MVTFKWGGIEERFIKLCMLPGTRPYSPGEPFEAFEGLGRIKELRHFPAIESGHMRRVMAEIVIKI